jgi:hypothetical protein
MALWSAIALLAYSMMRVINAIGQDKFIVGENSGYANITFWSLDTVLKYLH